MTVILILLAAMVVVGGLCFLAYRRDLGRAGVKPGSDSVVEPGQQCCGMHLTCEKDSLVAGAADTDVYYEDEELDRFAGRPADSYTPDEIEEFRDVLLTLRADEIAGWGRSVQRRGITLPESVRDELLMIVAEARAAM
jgi:hypothetical protein